MDISLSRGRQFNEFNTIINGEIKRIVPTIKMEVDMEEEKCMKWLDE